MVGEPVFSRKIGVTFGFSTPRTNSSSSPPSPSCVNTSTDLHEAREVVCARQHAAAEAVGADEPAREHRLLARLADRLAVRVLVDDRLADDEHAQVLRGAERREDVLGRVAGGEIGEVVADRVRVGRQVLVDEAGRAVNEVVGEGDLAADLADRLGLAADVADRVVQSAELAPLGEHVRAAAGGSSRPRSASG